MTILRSSAIALVCLVTAACQAYEPRPLDPTMIDRIFRDRAMSISRVDAVSEDSGSDGRAFNLLDGLSESEASAIALVFNSRLRVERSRLAEAFASRAEAGLWEDPVVGVDVARILASVPSEWIVGGTVGVTLPLSGRLDAEIKEADAEAVARAARVAAVEREVVSALRRKWRETEAHDSRSRFAAATVERIDATIEIADRLVESGEISRSAARLLKIERAARFEESAAERSGREEGFREVKRLMGLAPDADVSPRLEPIAVPAVIVPPDTAEVASNHPAVFAAALDYGVAEAKLEKEIAKQFPDVVIGPGGADEDGDSRVLFGIELPIPLWNANRRAIAIARAERDTAGVAYAVERERIASELVGARRRLEAAIESRELVRSTIETPLAEQTEEIRRLAELGRVDVVLMLETLSRSHEAGRRMIDYALEAALAALELETLTSLNDGAPFGAEGKVR